MTTTPNALTATEVSTSLTGFDELAIAKAFGADITAFSERPVMFLRALMFVVERRGGAKDAEAYRTVMEATAGQVDAYFPDETPDLDPEDPDTDQGKDSTPSA
jgi:hypothetical protein